MHLFSIVKDALTPRALFFVPDNAQLTKQTTKKASSLLLMVASINLLAGCSTVLVSNKSVSQSIDKQRGNIVTDKQLSTQTNTTLLSLGIDSTACLTQFDVCIKQIENNPLLINNRDMLALIAELYYAKADRYTAVEACNIALQRPPVDDYYANAPLSAEEEADKYKQSRDCLNARAQHLLYALRYSYAFLFYPSLTSNDADTDIDTKYQNQTVVADSTPLKYLSSDLDIQTRDIYNTASNELIKLLFTSEQYKKAPYGVSYFDSQYLPAASSTTNQNGVPSSLHEKIQFDITDAALATSTLVKVNLPINLDNTHAVNASLAVNAPNITNNINITNAATSANETLPTLRSSAELNFFGLHSISKREGIGVSFVTQQQDRYKTSLLDILTKKNTTADTAPASRIHRNGNLLLTGVVVVDGTNVDDVIHSQHIDVNLYDPNRTKAINILGEPYALAANFSSSYGLWLSENQLSGVGYLNLLARQQQLVLPQLFMLEPYDPNKRIIIMLHGLASSPATWVSITNDIFNDPTLRDNYQVWQIFYPTNLPMIENRYQIQKLINTAYLQNDPNGTHKASHNGVLIGHSMGAVIGRMMLSNDDLLPRLNDLSSNAQDAELNRLLRQSFGDQNLQSRFKLSRLPQINEAVFISAPFRGTNYADRWFTRALRRVIQLPIGFIQTITGNLTSIATQGELANNPFGALYLQNGASQLSDKSSFMRLTQDLKIADAVTYHSLIAAQDTDIVDGLAAMTPDSTTVDLSRNPETATFDNARTLSVDENSHTDKANIPPVSTIAVNQTLDNSISQDLSDGIVPYQSAHLAGAASETLITGNHSIQESPKAVLTLRKILHQHLQALQTQNTNK